MWRKSEDSNARGSGGKMAPQDESSSRMLRGIAVLLIGSGMARVVGLASLPILTRLYAPEDFGVLSIFAAFIQLAAPVATLRYLVAIPLPRTNQAAFSILMLCVCTALVLSSLAGVLLCAFGQAILPIFSMEMLVPYWWLMALGMLGAGLYETLSMWATRARNYRIIARTQFLQSLTGEGLKLVCGVSGFGLTGLLVGQAAGHSGGTARLIWFFGEDFRSRIRRSSWRRIRLAARRYRDFPIYRLPSQLLLVLSMQAPVLATAALYDAEVTGQIGLAILATSMPFLLVGQAASRAFYGEISREGAIPGANLFRITIQTMLRMALFALPVALILYFAGEFLFVTVFGADWRQGGVFVTLLAIMIVPQLATAPVLEVLNLVASQKAYLLIYALRCGIVLASAAFARIMALSAEGFIMLHAATAVLYYFAIMIYIIIAVRVHAKGLAK